LSRPESCGFKPTTKHPDYHPIDTQILDEVWDRDAHKCVHCGDTNITKETITSCGPYKFLIVHHKMPRRAGGNDSTDNLEIVCLKCHAKLERDYWQQEGGQR